MGEINDNSKPNEMVWNNTRPPCKHFRSRSVGDRREFPPPMALLAQTGNLLCHMPWVFKRSYTNNGRLVIQKANVKHHEFFRASRVNGRLTLQLVEGLVTMLETEEEEEEEEKKEEKEEIEKTCEFYQRSSSFKQILSLSEEDTRCNVVSELFPSSQPSLSAVSSLLSSTSAKSLSPSSSSLLPLLFKEKLNIAANDKQENGYRIKNEVEMSRSSSSPSLPSFLTHENSSGGCFTMKRSDSLFQMQMPRIHPIHI